LHTVTFNLGDIGVTALVGYTLRACLPLRRLLGVGLLCAAAVLLGLAARSLTEAPDEAFASVADGGLFPLVLPLAGLLVGDAVLGAEVRRGTFHFTWLSPVPVSQIALARWLGGSAVLLATVVPAFAAAALIAGAPDSAGPAAAGAAFGGIAYVAVLEALGAAFRRAAVISLALVFLVERLLGTALDGIAQWSPQWEGGAVFTAWAPDIESRSGIPTGGGAVVRLLVITAIGLGLATWRLRRIKLAGAAD
jgi:ABC-type transport system involved in multi-copper enzyme maturation permease subunit